jgi:hypothetical protein
MWHEVKHCGCVGRIHIAQRFGQRPKEERIAAGCSEACIAHTIGCGWHGRAHELACRVLTERNRTHDNGFIVEQERPDARASWL